MMDLICVDKEKCKKDCLCIIECPLKIIQKDDNGFPVSAENAAENCIGCGHCVAICPHNALILNSHLSKEYAHINSELKISEDTITQLVKGRRSVRHYKEQPVSKEEIKKLLDIVRWAPSASNLQPVHWLVIENRKAAFKIAEMVADWMLESGALPALLDAWNNGYDCVLRGAPNLIIAYAQEKAFAPAVDCSIAMATLELAASAIGIGTCWAGIFMMAANNHLPLIKYLNIPEGHKVFAALMMGYPKYNYHRIPDRNELKVRWVS